MASALNMNASSGSGLCPTRITCCVVIWIERRPGAVWAVGRVVNPQLRDSDEPRPEDVVFEGYELGDALDRANEALEDDVRVLEEDGRPADARPFTRKEVLPLLERWFFNR